MEVEKVGVKKEVAVERRLPCEARVSSAVSP